MSARSKVARGTIYGVAYLLVEGGGAILITKLLASNFDLYVAGVFTVLTYTLALSNILITSLGPAVTRAIASSDAKSSNFSLTVKACKFLAIACLILLAVIYAVFIVWHILIDGVHTYIVSVWALYCAGHLLRLAGLYKCFEVLGRGAVGVDRLYQLSFSFIYASAAIITLFLGGTIVILAFIYLLVGVITYLLSIYFKYKFLLEEVPREFTVSKTVGSLQNRSLLIAKEAGAMLLNNVTGFFIMNGDVFVVNYLFGVKVLAEYSLYSRLAALIVAIGGLVPLMYFPLVANAWSKKLIDECRGYRLDGIKFGFIFVIVSGVASVLIYTRIVDWTFSGVRQIPEWFIYLTLLYAAISIHTVVNGMPVIATGLYFFVKLSFVNAVLVFLFSLVCGYFFGLPGVPVGAIIASIIPTLLYRQKSLEVFSKTSDMKS